MKLIYFKTLFVFDLMRMRKRMDWISINSWRAGGLIIAEWSYSRSYPNGMPSSYHAAVKLFQFLNCPRQLCRRARKKTQNLWKSIMLLSVRKRRNNTLFTNIFFLLKIGWLRILLLISATNDPNINPMFHFSV